MRDFKHLHNTKVTKFPWYLGLFKKSMAPRVFANPMTAEILFKCEEILTRAVVNIERIRTYMRP